MLLISHPLSRPRAHLWSARGALQEAVLGESQPCLLLAWTCLGLHLPVCKVASLSPCLRCVGSAPSLRGAHEPLPSLRGGRAPHPPNSQGPGARAGGGGWSSAAGVTPLPLDPVAVIPHDAVHSCYLTGCGERRTRAGSCREML